MKLLRPYIYALLSSTALFADQATQDRDTAVRETGQLLEDTGQDALEDLVAIFGDQGPKEDGSYYVVQDIFNLPNRVKSNAIVKIKKIVHAKSDPDVEIAVQNIDYIGTASSEKTCHISQDKDFFIIKFPDVPDLEYDIELNMLTTIKKYAIYKYWVYDHTFEVEQPNEEWFF